MPATVLQSLNSGLRHALSVDERVWIIGEDIVDPYGGAFKVTRGLSTLFPERVISSPISEAGLVGIGAGMALRGLRPVIEIMFGDFLTLACDAITNTLSKYHWMYAGKVNLPVVIRTPMGGRRGYGPTHSQSLEKMFMGIPNIRVLAPVHIANGPEQAINGALGGPGDLLAWAILSQEDPTLFIENKTQYLSPLIDWASPGEFEIRSSGAYPPTYTFSIRSAPKSVVTLAAYGGMVDLAREAMLKLAYEDELFTELVVPTQLAPFYIEPVLESVQRTHRLVTIEEGTLTLGWGAEIVARASEALGRDLEVSCRLATPDQPVPASRSLEEAVLPGVSDMIQLVKSIV